MKNPINYFKMLPIDRIHANYLTWSENWTYMHSKYRYDILFLGLIRFYGFKINYSKILSNLIDNRYDVGQIKINKKYYAKN